MAACIRCGAPLRPNAKFCNRCGMPLAGLQGGRYRIVRQLGRGGMGAVYMAEDRELFGRPCVIKEMLNIYLSPADRLRAEQDFRREAELLAHLNQPGHPNIPEIYGHFVESGRHYLVMKYIAGQNLEERLAQMRRPFVESEVLRFMIPVCDALAYMHQRTPPVIHRDVKPANIILGEDERIWLVDFGLAKATLVDGAMVMMGGKTIAMGTPGYTPLEQWQRAAMPASDIYALGATIYHLLSGRDPRDRFASFPELDLEIIRSFSQWTPLRRVAPEVSEEMEELVMRALRAEPAQRPSAAELRHQFEVLLRDQEDPATRALRRFGPSVGRVLGVLLATFLGRIFAGSRRGRLGGGAMPTLPSGSAGRVCTLCDGTGVVLGKVRCPVCGGTGRW